MFNIGCWQIKRLKSDFWHSCSDQRSQSKLLWPIKGVKSLRIQSFKGFWKSRKILGSDFWESRDWDFEKNPGIQGYPRIPQGPADHWLPSITIKNLIKYVCHHTISKKNHFISYKLVNCEEIIGIDRRWKLLNAAKCLLGLRRGKVLGTDLVAHNLVHNLVVHNLPQPSARPSAAQASAQASVQPSAQPSAQPSTT